MEGARDAVVERLLRYMVFFRNASPFLLHSMQHFIVGFEEKKMQ